MTKILQISKITFIALALVVFAVGTYLVISAQSAMAYGDSGCGSCGGGSTGGGSTGGGGGEGGGGGTPTVPAPTCNISTNVSVVNSGDQYTISWNGTPAVGGTFKVNDYPVQAVGQKTYTFTAANYSRFVFTGQTAGGTCVSEVRVNRRVVEAPRCESFTATPSSLPVGGGSVNLVWDTTNATNATIDGQAVAGDGSMSVNVTASKTFTLNLSNSVGSASCTAPVVVATPTPNPTCDAFTANPTSIVRGNSSTLTWATTNATVVSINNGIGGVAVDGTQTVSPTNTTTYILTATREAKTVSCPVTVTVTDVSTPNPTCDAFTANPTSIVRGNGSTLTWATTNATVVSIDNGIGGVAIDGARVVSPANTTTYILTVTKDAQSVTCPVTITVTDIPTPNAPTCDSFTASPITINRGQSSTLTWATTNASSASINNAVGAITVDGSVSVSPIQSTIYTLTAVGNGGTVSCPVTVNVNQTTTGITCAANVNFSASPSSIYQGQSSTLTWSTTGLTNVRFDNLSPTTLSGSVTVSPNDTTIYTLIGTKGLETISCPVTIGVSTSGGGGGGGGSSNPTCKLTISDKRISLGERVTLKWDTSRATEITLKDNYGKTLIDTDGKSSSAKRDLYDGEITIRPDRNTTYILEASRDSRDRTCKVSVDVEDTLVVTQIRDQQPLVTGIALTQVPYTGFEAGPFMTSVFYSLLAAWALYMAYVLMGRRNGGNSMSSFTPAVVTADVTPAEVMFAPKTATAPVFYRAPESIMTPTATIGYEAHTSVTASIEAQAHDAHVLLSNEAISYFIAATANEDRTAILAGVLAAAKASYPSEDGWVVVSADRMVELATKF